MTDDERWRRREALFNEALLLKPGERERFLQESCVGDEAMARELRALLRHDAAEGGAIEGVVRDAAGAVLEASVLGQAGKRYGAWELERHLSDGGMGSVYLARRADGEFEQQAALKLLNPVLVGDQSRRRMEAERQILANLSHPNIAMLIDGGSGPDGVPYLVMEYVDGQPIDTYCSAEALDTPARLALFTRVCGAVEYAHRNLVVHRDIKPSNILVQSDGEPKLLDFGIAKLLDAEDAGLTRADQRLFTPAHASPEQISGAPVTTATDVYALGVLLYQLLSGRLPYAEADGTTGNPALLAQRILEDDPPTPSHAVTLGGGGLPDAMPARLARELRGDLDTIVMTALRREPERRYPSVRALALDIERYLADRPIQARPDSLAYRAVKLFQRRRVAILAAVVVIVALAAQSLFYFQRIVAERDAAEAARLRAENVVVFLEELLEGANRFASAGREVTVRALLDSGAERIESDLTDQPLEKARLLHTIGSTYMALSEYAAARELGQRALALRTAELGATHRDTLESRRLTASAIANGGDPVAAESILEETLALQREHVGQRSPAVARTLQELGVVRRVLGNPQAALVAHREAFDIFSGLDPDHRLYPSRALEMNQVGNALHAMGDYADAIAAFEQALELFASSGQMDSPLVGAALHNIGMALQASGRPRDGLPYLQRALEHTGRTLGEQTEDYEAQAATLGRTYASVGMLEEAETYIMLGLETARGLYGTEHQYYAYNLVNLARLRQLQDRHREALENFGDATAIYRATYGDYHRFLAAAEVDQAASMIEVGQAGKAAAQLEGVRARLAADPEYERHVEAVARSVHGDALARLGETSAAETLLLGAHQDLTDLLGPQHYLTVEAAQRLAYFHRAQGESGAADAVLRGIAPGEAGAAPDG